MDTEERSLHSNGEQLKLTLDKFKGDRPVTGLPEKRKRPHAYGAPSIDEFRAAIAKHRGSSKKAKAKGRQRP
jgi:ribosomal protein S21